MKTHVIHHYEPWFKPAYLANGLIGIRAGKNPLQDKQILEAGFVGASEQHGVEAIAPLPAPKLDIGIEDDLLSELEYRYEFVKQEYAFSSGEMTTSFRFSSHNGKTVEGEHLIFCSRSMPTMLIEKLTLTAQDDLTLILSASLDLRGLPLTQVMSLRPLKDADIVMLAESRQALSRDGIALLINADECFEDAKTLIPLEKEWGYENEFRRKAISCHLDKGQTVSVSFLTSYVPSSMHAQPEWQAVRMIKMATWYGFDRIREANRECWKEIWKGRITVTGASEAWQDAIDASYFYLYSTMHTSSPFGIAPFGLGDRFLYKGHVFWDCESFMFLLPLLSDPHIAASMLDYRFERLEAARNNARLNGYRGIQFPWQSGLSGCEVTRVSAGQAGGAGEQHVNMAVALAFAAYSYVTGDSIFIKEKAWPVLKGVSEWIESRVTKTERGYEILHVCGIDEGRDNVDNDGYTNVVSRMVLRETNHLAGKLGYPENPAWTEIADKLILPLDPDSGILMQYEGIREEKSMPVSSLMAYFPYGYTAGEECDKKAYQYYIDHDMWYSLSYPMLSGFLGLFPALLGDRETSLRFFERGNLDFFCEPFLQCSEMGRSLEEFGNPENRRTLFLTGRGSLMAALIYGLPRLNIWQDDPEQWFEGPITLPAGWEKITVGRVWIKGKPARITAQHGAEKSHIEWL